MGQWDPQGGWGGWASTSSVSPTLLSHLLSFYIVQVSTELILCPVFPQTCNPSASVLQGLRRQTGLGHHALFFLALKMT